MHSAKFVPNKSDFHCWPINQTGTPNKTAFMAYERAKQEKCHELCVCGYIRKHCIEYEVPQEVQQLCVSMYSTIIDQWNGKIFDKELQFDTNNNTAYLPLSETVNGWCHAFGSLKIIKGQSQLWKFKANTRMPNINKHSEKNEIMIGIIDANQIEKLCDVFNFNAFTHTYNGYGIYGISGYKYNGRSIKKYAKKINREHVITMCLDMTQKQNKNYGSLSYKINDKNYGVAFDKIDINKTYCMAVVMYYPKESIKILK
eukprot:515525_1